ncbi:sulfotransferase domain-containing protein [Oceanimonas baumannii]|uniref:sulfotransferase family protein n=1 Tax=Oceanimonas baumannii TaxID=129578 RepID=UPI001D185438|nr:sulfotransferase [Oceanimonas baumannii]MCC4264588.1 sulfotransferase domain-containing protein [Oceanimonas baumannii]
MLKINLFIVGAQKCGTSALAEFLSTHPDICLVKDKEAHIFDRDDIGKLTLNDIDKAYGELLPHYNKESVCCDATPLYMFYPDIPSQLADYNSSAKLIVLLRDPAERALSQYYMEKRRGSEPLSFGSALLAEKRRLNEDMDALDLDSAWRRYSYRSRGYYSHQLNNLYRYFPREQVLVLKNAELLNEHQHTLDKVTSFLELESIKCTAKNIFSGDYKVSVSQRLALSFLRLYYFPEYIRLRLHHGVVF